MGMNIWAALLKFRNPADKRGYPITKKVTTLSTLPSWNVRDRLGERNGIMMYIVKHAFTLIAFSTGIA